MINSIPNHKELRDCINRSLRKNHKNLRRELEKMK